MNLGAPLLIFTMVLPSQPAAKPGGNPRVVLSTTKGDITIELFAEEAPVTVENVLEYVRSGFYEGTVFHRVIPRFVIQGGGLTADMQRKPTRAPIRNEADNGLKNQRGTLSMARTSDPHSATSQFFINLVDNASLDQPPGGGWGYAVFGKVVAGMEVVDAIAQVPTGFKAGAQDVPLEPVTITKATIEE